MSNRIRSEVSESFQFDDEDEDEVAKAKAIVNAESLRRLEKENRLKGTRSRGLRFTDEDYNALKTGMKETRSASVPKYIMALHEERQVWEDMRRILKGIDRRMTDLELHVREELRKFQATFEVAD